MNLGWIYFLYLFHIIHSLPRVIIDVDSGIDDAQGISLLLKAESNNLLKIEAITFVNGNTNLTNIAKNVIRLLETGGRTDIPLFYGAHRALIQKNENENYYGQDGFGDIQNYKKTPNITSVKKENAIQAIYRIIKQNPRKVTIISVGPVTDLALSIVMYSDFMNYVKEIVIMGGNYKEPEAEFNFKSDPEAAHILLESTKVKITFLTWQACQQAAVPLSWRFGIVVKNNPLWFLIDSAEKNQFKDHPLDEIYTPCDLITVLSFLFPKELVGETKKYSGKVEIEGEKRGQIILSNDCKQKKYLNFITKINLENYKNLFVKEFSELCDNMPCKNVYLN